MKKRFILMTITLAVVLFAGAMFLPTEAKAYTSGYYTYTVSNGEAKITDCSTSISGAVTIPSTLGGYPVTSIGYGAFTSCVNLTGITIPDSVTSIDDYAFYRCSDLTSITIPDSVTSIGGSAFSSCSKLQYNVYDNGKYLGNESNPYFALIDTTSDSVIQCQIHPNTKLFGGGAFSGCSSLTSITIPDSVTWIGGYAFSYCSSLTSITIPNSVTRIGRFAFYDCSNLTNITIPDSVTSIGFSAFDYCSSLKNVVYCGSAEQWHEISIGGYNSPLTKAARQYHLDEVALYHVCDICEETLSTCADNDNDTHCDICGTSLYIAKGTCGENLTWVLDEEWTLTILGEGAMDYVNNAPWFSFSESVKSVVIHEGVTSIGDCAFGNCYSLTSITIPDGVTSIGDHAFLFCSSLTSITIPDSVTSIDYSAFSYCSSLTSITIPNSVTSIGSSAFYECHSLTSITIPDSVTDIGNDAFFYCSSLTSVTIGNSVTNIGDGAFDWCSSLRSITIPDSVTSIGYSAFDDCYSLKNVVYCGSEEQWNEISIGRYNSPLMDAARQYHLDEAAPSNVCDICGMMICEHVWEGGDCFTPATCTICGGESEEMAHTWIVGTCTSPKFCFVCETIAPAPGHNWVETCTTPKTCTVCGEISGTAQGHNWIAATCTAPKTCSVCGETQGEVLEHSWVNANCTAPMTCTGCGLTEGDVVHVWIDATCTVPKHCDLCGVTEGTASHIYADDNDAICDTCGEIRMMYDNALKFYGNAGMSLKDYIGMQILMKNSTATGYDKVYAIAVQKTPTGDITTTITGTPYAGQYTYFEQKILARSMCDEVTLTLYGEKNGIVYQGGSVTTSVLQLSMDKLKTYKDQNDTAKCKIIVDMLNFGAAVQTTFNVNTHQLPNANLGEYAIYGSTYEPELNATNSITGTATVKVGQHNISMQDRVEIQLLFTKDISAYRAVATMDGVDVEVNVDAETYAAYGYTVVRVPVAPANFRETYTIALYDANGEPVTQIYNVSVEGYANARRNDVTKHPLDVAFMRYSDSVAAVFRNN